MKTIQLDTVERNWEVSVNFFKPELGNLFALAGHNQTQQGSSGMLQVLSTPTLRQFLADLFIGEDQKKFFYQILRYFQSRNWMRGKRFPEITWGI